MARPRPPTVLEGLDHKFFRYVRAYWLSETDTWGRTVDLGRLADAAQGDSHESRIWTPDLVRPTWVDGSPSAFLLARDLIAKGLPLTGLSPRDFERLIGEMLERDGWRVEVMRGTKDGGVDVEAFKIVGEAGLVRTIWQAKRFGPNTFVGLHHVKELSATLDRSRATKAIMVTTSRLTKGAVVWIRSDTFRLSYKEGEDVHEWIMKL